MNISLRADVKKAASDLRLYQRQVLPAAVSRALNNTAFQVRKVVQEEMEHVFDRPTRWTLNAPWVEKARPTNFTARLALQGKATKSTDASSYLDPHIHGGSRNLKRSEKLLQSRGILPPGMFAVPGAGARLDKYGNMSRGQLQEILANVRAHFDKYQRTREGAATKYYHAIIKGTNGIWLRRKSGVIPVLVFVKAPQYRRRFMFYQIGEAATQRIFPGELDQQLRTAIGKL